MYLFINKKTGFTLIEILIALVILSGATIIISRIWLGNTKRIQKVSDYHKIVELMEQKISELEFDWRKKNFDSIPREDKGTFEGEKYFSWSVKTQPLTLPDPQSFMNLLGQTDDMAIQVSQVTIQFLSQAIIEAKLTIHYKKGLLESAYSLTTYIVDHNRKLPLSMPSSGSP
ncbi:MAG: type II secretion system protein [Bdellovibrionales bacterium]|nr:type II secretion system protein [Bdellovibrionales bacterium]